MTSYRVVIRGVPSHFETREEADDAAYWLAVAWGNWVGNRPHPTRDGYSCRAMEFVVEGEGEQR